MNDLLLKNGEKAIFINLDDFGRPVYELNNGSKVCCVNLDGSHLHSMSKQGEPECPLKSEYQQGEIK